MKKIIKSVMCLIIAALLVATGFGITNNNDASEIRMCDLDYVLVSQ